MNMNHMIKQAQAMQKKLMAEQEKFAAEQAKLDDTLFTGQAGNGLVSVELRGSGMLESIALKDAAMEDKDMLEDLILVAFRDAFAKRTTESDRIEKTMKSTMGQFNIPGLPF